jgi:hypothetical protein
MKALGFFVAAVMTTGSAMAQPNPFKGDHGVTIAQSQNAEPQPQNVTDILMLPQPPSLSTGNSFSLLSVPNATTFTFSANGLSMNVGDIGGPNFMEAAGVAALAVESFHRYNQLQAFTLMLWMTTSAGPLPALARDLQTERDYQQNSAYQDPNVADAVLTDIDKQVAFLNKQVNGFNQVQALGILAEASNDPVIMSSARATILYTDSLLSAAKDAHTIPSRINAYLNSGASPASLLRNAMKFQGTQYYDKQTGLGLTCDQLVSKAAGVGQQRLYTMPVLGGMTGGMTVTQSWYNYGLSEGTFRAIYPIDETRIGPAYVAPKTARTLDQLAQDVGNGLIHLDPGDLIVSPGPSVLSANGHAALFVQAVKDDGTGRWRIITFDANNSNTITRSVNGHTETFPGHQVGFHLTGSQWNGNDPVVVFRPVGHFEDEVQNLATCDITDHWARFIMFQNGFIPSVQTAGLACPGSDFIDGA